MQSSRERYGPVRPGLEVAYRPSTGVCTALAMCAGPESGQMTRSGRSEHGEQLFQPGLADQVGGLAAGRQRPAVFGLDGARTTGNNDAAAAPVEMLDDSGESFDRPVAVIAGALAAAGADYDQRRACLAQRRGERPCVVVERNIPAQRRRRGADRRCERHHCIEGVLLRPVLDSVVSKQPLEVARALAVEADFFLGTNVSAQQIGTQRRVHAQGHVEATRAELPADIAPRRTAARLVENDKLHAVDAPASTWLPSCR